MSRLPGLLRNDYVDDLIVGDAGCSVLPLEPKATRRMFLICYLTFLIISR